MAQSDIWRVGEIVSNSPTDGRYSLMGSASIYLIRKGPKMRFDTLFFAAAAAAVFAVFAGSDAQAQSGSRAASAPSVLSGQFQGAPAGIAPNFSAPTSVVQGFSQGQGFVQGQNVVQGSGFAQGFPQGGVASFVEGQTQWAPEYVASPSSYSAQRAVQTVGCKGCRGKGPVSTGQIVGGCRNCAQEPPIQTQQDYSAVPSCCGTLGQLDIPSLFTPPRLDRAPIGAAVGRPLFRQWQGF